jgi:hypothetical protein
VEHIERFPDEQWLSWKEFMRPLVRAAADTGLNDYFRAGQSMSHLIFSTAEEHGLELIDPPPPRVTLGRDEDLTFFVAISRSNVWFDQPDRKDTIGPDNALSALKAYLYVLWVETRPGQPVPDVVAEPPDAADRFAAGVRPLRSGPLHRER